MSNLEERSRKNTRNKNLQEAVLRSIQTAGFLSVVLLAPNALQIFGKRNALISKKDGASVNSVRHRLIKNGLIECSEGRLSITKKGESFLQRLEQNNFKISRPKKWDKKWRIVIFDIKEERKSSRDKLRRTLIQIGFKKLQNSVWVYPYNCENLITLLKTDFKIGKDILYIIAEHIEYDRPLREYFDIA